MVKGHNSFQKQSIFIHVLVQERFTEAIKRIFTHKEVLIQLTHLIEEWLLISHLQQQLQKFKENYKHKNIEYCSKTLTRHILIHFNLSYKHNQILSKTELLQKHIFKVLFFFFFLERDKVLPKKKVLKHVSVNTWLVFTFQWRNAFTKSKARKAP